jgi:hypothetical protein
MAKEKKRGPKGGVKHQPGRGHQNKSGAQRKRRFARKVLSAKHAEAEKIRNEWEIWDTLTEEQRRLLPELQPERPRCVDDE